MHIVTGERVATLCEGERRFDDAARFTSQGFCPPATSPGDWLAGQIESVVRAAECEDNIARPLHVAAPAPALIDPAARGACLDALHRVRGCAPEITLEFDDWVLGAQRRDLVFGLSRYKSVGFRISVNATANWQMRSSEAVRLLIDSVRVSAPALFADAELAARCHEIALEGTDIIVDRPRWRDAAALGDLGVLYASRPLADA